MCLWVFYLYGIFILFLSIHKLLNLIKCKFHGFMYVTHKHSKFVWRQSEFAFLVRRFGCRTFYLFGEKMEKRSVKRTIIYMLCVTVLPQALLLSFIASVLVFAYNFNVWNSGYIGILGAVGFLAMLFFAITCAVIYDSYAVPIYAKTHGCFTQPDAANSVEKYEYRWGRKDTFTGKRPLYIRRRSEPVGAGIVFILALKGFIVSVFGTLHFAVEALRVVNSEERQAAWDDARSYYESKLSETGKKRFYQVPALCLATICALWVLISPLLIYNNAVYDKGNIKFEFTEKENYRYNSNGLAEIYLFGEIKNDGSKEIESLEVKITCYDSGGELLLSQTLSFSVGTYLGFEAPLSRSSPWSFRAILKTQADAKAEKLWNSSIEDIKIKIEIIETEWSNGMYREF